MIKEYEFIKSKVAMDLMNFDEFINFYIQISMYILNNKEFEKLIKNYGELILIEINLFLLKHFYFQKYKILFF